MKGPHALPQTPDTPLRIVVDMTPVLPGGENGGAKILAMELLRRLADSAPQAHFIVATVSGTAGEIASLEGGNLYCVRMDEAGSSLNASRNFTIRARQELSRVLPPRLMASVGKMYERISQGRRAEGLLRHFGADVLFCPFTGSSLYDSRTPAVSIVHDLQHRYHPEFFSPEEIQQRNRVLRRVSRLAARVVCTSQFVRNTVLANSRIPPDRVDVIPILLAHRFPKLLHGAEADLLRRLGIVRGRYLIYPANFWPHKNHYVLLTAFQKYRNRELPSHLKLVLTGSTPKPNREALIQTSREAGLADSIVFAGYLPDEELGALLDASIAIIFPSLFEGFGMPLLEGMAMRKPLLVSRAASLPEIGGSAPLYFDPRDPEEIAAAIGRLENEPGLADCLANRSAERLTSFDGPAEMARRYMEVLRQAAREAPKKANPH